MEKHDKIATLFEHSYLDPNLYVNVSAELIVLFNLVWYLIFRRQIGAVIAPCYVPLRTRIRSRISFPDTRTIRLLQLRRIAEMHIFASFSRETTIVHCK